MNSASAPPDRASGYFVKGRLDPTSSQRAVLDDTFQAFADACNWAIATGLQAGTTGTVRLHHLCYRDLRTRFGLHANLAIRAVACAARLLKEEPGTLRSLPPTCIEYDTRIFSLSRQKQTVSLATVVGRLKEVRVVFDDPLVGHVLRRAVVYKYDQEYVLHIYGSVDGTEPRAF